MTRRHTSFLLRCWDLGGDSERIDIEHVQSGTKGLVRSVGAAIEWICTYGYAEPPHDREINQMSTAIGNERRGGGDN